MDREPKQQKSPDKMFYSSTKITPVNPGPAEHLATLPPKLRSSFQAPQTRSDVSIISNESYDYYSTPSSHNNLILSEDSKSIMKSHQQVHKPVKVHVAHRPNTDDTSRVYNPYPVLDEYEQYTKNGFLFEPIAPVSKPPSKHQTKADVVFTSESISPYVRKDANSLVYKNPVKNDKLSDIARGYTNSSFVVDSSETEFQNYNNLKNTSGYISKKIVSQPSYNSTSDGGLGNSSVENIVDVPNQRVAKNRYEDEYDIANKIQRQTPYQNFELINSISSELKKMKSAYRQDKK